MVHVAEKFRDGGVKVKFLSKKRRKSLSSCPSLTKGWGRAVGYGWENGLQDGMKAV